MNLSAQNYLTRGFWGDEAWTALISRLPVSEIIRVTGEDFHPPFYYFIVHFWGQLFGFSEIVIRLISIMFFLATPVIVYQLVKTLFKDTRHALAASLLTLFSPILFTYAFEARSYALLAFLSVSSAYALWRARTEKGYTWRILYLILGAVSVYTHYYAWFILASHGIYLLLFERKYLLRLLPPALGILLIQLPWIPTLLSQVGEVSRDYWIAPINERTHWEFYLRVLGGDYTTRLQHPATFLISAFIFVGLFKLDKGKAHKLALSSEIKFLLTWIIVPTLIPSLISLKTPVFFYRYLIFTSIPLLILATRGLDRMIKPIFYSGLILIAGLYLSINYQAFFRHLESMREVKQTVYQTKAVGDGPIYTVLPAFAEVYYYFGDSEQIIVTPEGLVQFSGKSLLDSYERNGLITIEEPPTSTPYWYLEPGPKATLIDPASIDLQN